MCDVHAYAQHIGLLASSITVNLVNEHELITVLTQGLADGPFRSRLFRLELDSLEQAIAAAEQKTLA